MDALDALTVAVVAWLALAVAACFARRPWPRTVAAWLLCVLFAALLVFAFVTGDAGLGLAASGIALMTWLAVKEAAPDDEKRVGD